MSRPRFHPAFPVRDLAEARAFRGGLPIRFQGQSGKPATLFFLDPSGNALACKAFADDAMGFAQ